MLTAAEIRERHQLGNIQINPYDEEQLQPNSYDLTLAPTVLRVKDQILDFKRTPHVESIEHDGRGRIMLLGGDCYLATHNEYVAAPDLIMCIHGRSTVARYFVQVHQVAGFGDIGYWGYWTLELRAAMDTIVYVGMRIAQVSFHVPFGPIQDQYEGRYVSNTPTPKPPEAGNF